MSHSNREGRARHHLFTHEYYRGCCLDEGSFIDYALLSGSPSRGFWMIPGTWKED